ncbi:MAG: glycosyltransferase family 9 protein [Verrucomicrobia bacterium]|nr:glycosyltransferase family 9 protein [Verrucomicrobiota bacterium]
MKLSKNCFAASRKVKCIYFLLDFYHFFLTRFFFWKNKPSRQAPQKILLANWGALGDVVLSSGVIAVIRTKFPECKIGFLASKKSKVALESCPPVDWVHEADSWLAPGRSFWKNGLNYLHFLLTQQRRLAKELSQIKYDIAIELRPFLPNVIPLLWNAGIPVRIGFSSSGNSRLLNQTIEWHSQDYLPYCYPSLLKKLDILLTDPDQILPKISSNSLSPLLAKWPYLLFHLCSSDDRKELPLDFWRSLRCKCEQAGYKVYFTGMGNREKENIDKVAKDNEFNLCNRLDWKQLVQHIQSAQGIVSVDSVPIHLAAALDVSCAAIFRNTNYSHLWKPNRTTTRIFEFKDNNICENVFETIKEWMSETQTDLNKNLKLNDELQTNNLHSNL